VAKYNFHLVHFKNAHFEVKNELKLLETRTFVSIHLLPTSVKNKFYYWIYIANKARAVCAEKGGGVGNNKTDNVRVT